MGKCRVLSDDELFRIHQACHTSRDRLLVTFFERTGYLPAAAATLCIGDVVIGSTIKRFLQIASGYMRGEKSRPPVALHEDLRQKLQEHLIERQADETYKLEWPLFLSRKSKTIIQGLDRATMWREFKRIAKAAGVERNIGLMSLFKVYTLRLYKESRWNVQFVQENLGHQEIHTTFALLGNIVQECQQQHIPLFT